MHLQNLPVCTSSAGEPNISVAALGSVTSDMFKPDTSSAPAGPHELELEPVELEPMEMEYEAVDL